MGDGALLGNRIVRVLVQESETLPATPAWTEFGGDERKGMISFAPIVSDESAPRPGFTLDVENQRTGRASGTVTCEAQDNPTTGPLFYGERRGLYLHYQDLLEGIGTGKPASTGKVVLGSVEHSPDGAGLLGWSVSGDMPERPVPTVQ